MRTVAALWLVALSAGMQAQSPQPAKPLKVFTAPDGTFQFSYSSTLIVCEAQKQESGGYLWAPAKHCMAYHPVCDGLTPEKYEAIACLAYPRNKFTASPAFEAATFSVEIINEVPTAKACTAKPRGDTFTPQPPTRIQGVSVTVFKFGEWGMSQNTTGNVYRTFHNGKCYQLGVNDGRSTAGADTRPWRDMTRQNWDSVNRLLEQARDSFRFLK